MKFMAVTLDVSKLSGWLKAFAFCRVERRGIRSGKGAGQEMWEGVWATEAHAVCRGRPD
tara:strand:- start:392 stop:568 length:177 start_codon:yes stop_codon:yes gene_type:complete